MARPRAESENLEGSVASMEPRRPAAVRGSAWLCDIAGMASNTLRATRLVSNNAPTDPMRCCRCALRPLPHGGLILARWLGELAVAGVALCLDREIEQRRQILRFVFHVM